MSGQPDWRRAGLTELGAVALRDQLASGMAKPMDVAEAFLERIAEREPEVHAFAFHDPDLVRSQMGRAEARRRTGRPAGSLNGVPVAVKDIFDTADMPTENGTAIDRGRRPRRDATVVSRLRAAGAVILGKTVTTELAYLAPGPTRNPIDPTRTPGGSSSGSAAAVAAGMAPVAIGTQTNGSVLRPAAFCGVYGFKPSHGLIPRTGVLMLSRPLDTVGVFARSIDDAALVADALAGHDGIDPDAALAAPPLLLETASSKPPVPPDIAFVKTPFWDRAAPETRAGLAELVTTLGKRCAEIALADVFAEAAPLHRTMMVTGMARHLSGYEAKGRDQLSEAMRAALDEGRQVKAVEYLRTQDMREALNASLDEAFDRFDAILTPAVIGEAPPGLQSTGDPIFCTIWSFCGAPAITLPLLEGPSGLPVGVQLVGRRGNDGRLLRTARWLVDYVAGLPAGERRAD